MPVFVYRAKKGPGETVEGELTAESQPAAIARLDAAGCIPIWIHEKNAAELGPADVPDRVRVRLRDLNLFTRQLSSLLRTGVPILRALLTIREQTENRRMQRIAAALEESVRDGRMLSEAMAHFPRVFPELYINMVRSGESAGVLDEILLRLAQAQDADQELRVKVQTALAYPLLVLAVGLLSVVLMLVFFLPRIVHIFERTQQALPLPTRLLMGASQILTEGWYWILLAIVAAAIGLRGMLRRERGRLYFERLALGLPLAGRFIRDADLARFARTLALLIQTGIPIDRAIQLSGSTMHNGVLREQIAAVGRGTVQQGASLAAGLRRQPQVPIFVANMVAVGEESGRLEDALTEVSRLYERELERGMKIMTALLEPALILVVGAIVGFIIFATLLPIFQIGAVVK
jgi:type II secretory pathway component PulF